MNVEIDLGENVNCMNESQMQMLDADSELSFLSKRELLELTSDPFWVKARWTIFFLFWIITIGLLVGAVLTVAMGPTCARVEYLKWWQKESMYEIDVAKFCDSNGDGVGDLDGILEKQDYLEKLGVRTIVLKNITDDSIEKLAELKKKLIKKDIHIVVDIPINQLDQENLKSLLMGKVDGIMIVDVENYSEPSQLTIKLNQLKDLANEVSKMTFEDKFLGAKMQNKSKDINLDIIVGDDLDTKSESNKIWPSLYMRSDVDPTNRAEAAKAQALTFLLRGTPFFTSGSEIKTSSSKSDYMKWDDSYSCGFTSNSSIDNKLFDSCNGNILHATAHGTERSALLNFIDLIQLHGKESILWGEFKMPQQGSYNESELFTFTREAPGFDGFLIAINTGSNQVVHNFEKAYDIPDEATVAFFNDDTNRYFQKGQTITTSNLALQPGDFIVAQFNRQPKPDANDTPKSSPH